MSWEELEQKYYIRFKKEDGGFREVREWLDDIYLTLGHQDVMNLMEDVFTHGDELFADFVEPRKRF